MFNPKNKSIVNTPAEKHISTQKTARSISDERHYEHFSEMALDSTHYAFHILKENSSDYKTINTDKDLSSVDKAIGKRKVLAADITICFCSIGAFLGLSWWAKKIFLA